MSLLIVSSEYLNLLSDNFYGQSLFDSLGVPWMEVKSGFQDPEKSVPFPDKRCPFNRGNKREDYMKIFPGPNFVSPEWRCPEGEVSLYSKRITVDYVGADVVE